MKRQVLVVDDDRATRDLLALGLEQEGFSVALATGGASALTIMRERQFDVVIADLNMPEMSGTALCERAAAEWPDVPVVVITAFGSLETAIEAIRAGAYDFITKPFELEAVAVAIERACRHHELRAEVKRLRAAVTSASPLPGLIGTSQAMVRLYPLLERIAESDMNVLLTGESGTGKEVVAGALHARSARANGRFVAINCAALPETLLESELFGHVRGAFTDAKNARSGLFVEASGGTVFLDEIGDMPLAVQPKLLRALEQRSVRPVGGSREMPFDARLIAATNRDLESMVEEGRFRADLYYRLAVITVGLPPLRARENDVLLLAQHFLSEFASSHGSAVCGISSTAAAKLRAYPWPGNVRELKNAIERAVALTRFDHIVPDDLPDKIRDPESRASASEVDALAPLEEIERRYILKVLEASGGNKTLAAETLGLNRKTLYRKLAAWGVDS